MAAICKACTNVEPELTLKFLIPHLCERIETILAERVNHKKSDHELQVSFRHDCKQNLKFRFIFTFCSTSLS